VRLPSTNKNLFDKGNWQAFIAVVKYNEDLTVGQQLPSSKERTSRSSTCPGSFVAIAKDLADVTKLT